MKWPPLKAVNATTMKKIRITILTPTMIALIRALSRVPSVSRAVMPRTTTTAGMLNMPPSSGDFEIATGSANPNAAFRNSLMFPPQPTATAATETPYSRIRSQPMMKATSSPSVA